MSNEIIFFLLLFTLLTLAVFYFVIKDIKTQVDINTDNIVEVAKSLKDTQDVVKNNAKRLDCITLLRATGDIKKIKTKPDCVVKKNNISLLDEND